MAGYIVLKTLASVQTRRRRLRWKISEKRPMVRASICLLERAERHTESPGEKQRQCGFKRETSNREYLGGRALVLQGLQAELL